MVYNLQKLTVSKSASSRIVGEILLSSSFDRDNKYFFPFGDADTAAKAAKNRINFNMLLTCLTQTYSTYRLLIFTLYIVELSAKSSLKRMIQKILSYLEIVLKLPFISLL